MKKITVLICIISLILMPLTSSVNLTNKEELPQMLEEECWNTLVSEFGFNGSTCNVTEFDSEGNIVWQLTDLNVPQDAERLPNGNTLITIHGDENVTEFDRSGHIVWIKTRLKLPVDAERLPNGNTLIAQYGSGRVTEVDKYGTMVWEMTGLRRPFDAERLPNENTLIVEGEVYPDGRVIEVDDAYNEVWNISGLDGPVDAERLSNGNTLITEHIGRNVTEFDENGEIIWQKTGLHMPKDAERLPNGNTLIAECAANRVIEVNPDGDIVWLIKDLQYPVDAERVPCYEPPTIEITNPKEGHFHFREKPLFKFFNKTFMYGPANIKVNITSTYGVEKVEFYINGELKKTVSGEEDSYEYRWAPILCGRYTINATVYGNWGQNASDEIKVLKWRFHPGLLLAGALALLLILSQMENT